jgi:hypothetical protein
VTGRPFDALFSNGGTLAHEMQRRDSSSSSKMNDVLVHEGWRANQEVSREKHPTFAILPPPNWRRSRCRVRGCRRKTFVE